MASKYKFSSRKVNSRNMEAVYSGLSLLTFSFQRRLKKMLNKRGAGKPSPVGEPPARQTGRLSNSWVAGKHKRKKKRGNPVISLTQGAGAGEAVKYAAILEDVKRHNRPFIVPTLKLFRGGRAQRIFLSRYKREIQKINNGGPYG